MTKVDVDVNVDDASCVNSELNIPPQTTSTSTITPTVCSFVAEATVADIAVFDIVLLNQGMCHHVDIQQGVFTHHNAANTLPYQNELIGLRLLGKHIVIALEHGMHAASLSSTLAGAYPITAGIRYQKRKEVDTTVTTPPKQNNNKKGPSLSSIGDGT